MLWVTQPNLVYCIYKFQLSYLRLASREAEGEVVGGKWIDVFLFMTPLAAVLSYPKNVAS